MKEEEYEDVISMEKIFRLLTKDFKAKPIKISKRDNEKIQKLNASKTIQFGIPQRNKFKKISLPERLSFRKLRRNNKK